MTIISQRNGKYCIDDMFFLESSHGMCTHTHTDVRYDSHFRTTACVSHMFVKIISFSLFQHGSLPHSRSRQSISKLLSALAWQIYSRRMETSGSYFVKSSLSVPICPAGTLIKLSERRPQSQHLKTLHQCCF